MAEKTYTPREAALAILAKAAEIAKKHEHIGWGKLHGKLEREGYSKESADKIAGSIKAKVDKSDEADMSDVNSQPNDAQMAKGEYEGHAENEIKKPIPGDAVEPKADHPGGNDQKDNLDKHAADGDNAPMKMKGHIKLAKFMGRMEHKRGMKQMPKPKLPE